MAKRNNYITASHIIVLFYLLLLLDASSQFRHRRNSVNYVIDTLVVVDDIVFSKWVGQDDATSKLKTYVSLLFHQANERLKMLDNQGEGWSVQLSISRILVNTNPLATAERIGNSNQIDSAEALKTLRLWAVLENYHTTFDHVLLITGETFDSSFETAFTNLVKGRSYVGTMCDTEGYSVSFVQEIGGFQSAGYMAHEIAHSLGAVHDGEGNSSDCSSADRYIMAAASNAKVTSSNKENPWYFSPCTSRSIGNFLATPQASCLTTNQEPVIEFADSQNTVPGLQYNGSEQCQMIYNSASRLCLGQNFGTLNEVCALMNCLDTARSTSTSAVCVEYLAAEGTACANGKLCIRGKCVRDNRAPATVVSGLCPFGDSVAPINGMSCAEYIPSHPYSCYNDNVRTLCCASCESIKSEFEVCPYGDRKRGCLEEYCYSIRPDGTRYDEDCCGACSYHTALECVDVPSIEGMSCAQYIHLGGLQRCYNASVSFQCCHSCAEQRNGPEGCEYGDWILGNSCASFISSGGNCTEDRNLCCQTCLDYLNSSPSVVINYNYMYTMYFVVILRFILALF